MNFQCMFFFLILYEMGMDNKAVPASWASALES